MTIGCLFGARASLGKFVAFPGRAILGISWLVGIDRRPFPVRSPSTQIRVWYGSSAFLFPKAQGTFSRRPADFLRRCRAFFCCPRGLSPGQRAAGSSKQHGPSVLPLSSPIRYQPFLSQGSQRPLLLDSSRTRDKAASLRPELVQWWLRTVLGGSLNGCAVAPFSIPRSALPAAVLILELTRHATPGYPFLLERDITGLFVSFLQSADRSPLFFVFEMAFFHGPPM